MMVYHTVNFIFGVRSDLSALDATLVCCITNFIRPQGIDCIAAVNIGM